MELLIMKSGDQYIRVKEEVYHLGRIDKASVYPLEKLNAVRQQAAALQQQGFKDVSIRKLMITEEPLYD